MRKDGRYLITGGSGSIGRALIARLYNDGFTNLVALARNEGNLITYLDKFHIDIVAGDIADPYICEKVCKGVDGIFHLGAFKHVSLAEDNVHQCVKSNIIGTMNLLNESLKNIPELFVFISIDKVINVKGVYSASKLLGERLVAEFAKFNLVTKYRIVRFGNIWDTTGSVIAKWKPLMEAGKEIILTDPKATRFFSTIDDAVNFVLQCADSNNTEPYIPKDIKSISMGEALEYCQTVYGKCPVKVVGLQEGESLHEILNDTFSNQTSKYTKEEFVNKFLR